MVESTGLMRTACSYKLSGNDIYFWQVLLLQGDQIKDTYKNASKEPVVIKNLIMPLSIVHILESKVSVNFNVFSIKSSLIIT